MSRGVVIGIGNDLRGDDGAGLIAARDLAAATGSPLILAGEVPENYLDVVRGHVPDWVLLVDATDFGADARRNGDPPVRRRKDLHRGCAIAIHPSTVVVAPAPLHHGRDGGGGLALGDPARMRRLGCADE